MTGCRVEFGYHPEPLHLRAGPITVEPLPELAEIVADMETSDGIENDWIYAPPQEVRATGGMVRTLPYPSRVFGLPKTHTIEHASAEGEDQLTFHLWALSLFTGMRLTPTEAGFIDATPIRPQAGGFHVVEKQLGDRCGARRCVLGGQPRRATTRSAVRRGCACVVSARTPAYSSSSRHASLHRVRCLLRLGEVDASAKGARHPCRACDLDVPSVWHAHAGMGRPRGSRRRSGREFEDATLHEALFVGEPLGFALHGVGTSENLTLEMEALICRFLVALVGGDYADYVRSPVNTRQRHGLDLT